MRRGCKRLIATSVFLGTVAGRKNALQPRRPQFLPLASTIPLSNTVNIIDSTVDSTVDTVVDTVDTIVDTVDTTIDTTVDIVVDVSVEGVADVLTPASQSLLTDAPITVLDGLLDAILYPHPRDPLYPGWQYYGCFNAITYISTRTPKSTSPANGMSPSICISLCVADGLEVAAVINDQCYCSNDTPTFDHGSDQCTTPCPLNPKQLCGGTQTMSVFRRAITAIPGPLPAIPEPTGWRYSGCFFGDAWIASAPYSVAGTLGSEMNAETCTTTCATGDLGIEYTYSALYVDTCYCSNSALSTLLAGIGQCTQPCVGVPTEACGGLSNYAPYLDSPGSLMITLYTTAPPPPSTTPLLPGTQGPLDWIYYGCYYGALYLLDTILGGIQVSALLDATSPSISGERCVELCLAADTNPILNFALTLGATCFCNVEAPPEALLALDQSLCNEPCYGNPDERCGGDDPTAQLSLGTSLVNIFGRQVEVSGFLVCCRLFVCSKLCSVLSLVLLLGFGQVL
ncbi:hypothetical protein BDW02DRAFT_423912 [Decorospora gaudefroyi]|uniref:WSC domain-containing protein n=1 Tax=Decorospora gaudefroyi TaxID=184978 RepID=A0A6A5K876_9PLEO|nr:hypothetical protein BDW02DRAFT_423912 [Decorospora gaudefroyi]